MSNTNLTAVVEEMLTWQELAAGATAHVNELKDIIKQEFTARDITELLCGTHMVRYGKVLTQKLDQRALKEKLPEVYTAFLSQTEAMRFSCQ